jgi:hypothetical protein
MAARVYIDATASTTVAGGGGCGLPRARPRRVVRVLRSVGMATDLRPISPLVVA